MLQGAFQPRELFPTKHGLRGLRIIGGKVGVAILPRVQDNEVHMLPPAKATVEPFRRVRALSNRVVVQKSGEPQRKQWLVWAFFCWSRSHMEGTKIITHLVVIPNGVIGQVREQLPVARVLAVVPPMR